MSSEWDNVVITNNNRRAKVRFVAYGYVNDRLHMVVYTIRADAVRRIISIMRGTMLELFSPSPEEEAGIAAEPDRPLKSILFLKKRLPDAHAPPRKTSDSNHRKRLAQQHTPSPSVVHHCPRKRADHRNDRNKV